MTVAFFQMPVHEKLSSSVRYKPMKAFLEEQFPSNQFYWLDSKLANEYKTSDGVHLLYGAAKAYTLIVNSLINHHIQ